MRYTHRAHQVEAIRLEKFDDETVAFTGAVIDPFIMGPPRQPTQAYVMEGDNRIGLIPADGIVPGNADICLLIPSAGNVIVANKGDWILKSDFRSIWPVRHEDFVRNYE